MTSRPFVGIHFCIRMKRREVFCFYEKLLISSFKGQIINRSTYEEDYSEDHT